MMHLGSVGTNQQAKQDLRQVANSAHNLPAQLYTIIQPMVTFQHLYFAFFWGGGIPGGLGGCIGLTCVLGTFPGIQTVGCLWVYLALTGKAVIG